MYYSFTASTDLTAPPKSKRLRAFHVSETAGAARSSTSATAASPARS
jgi:hypothetical protein